MILLPRGILQVYFKCNSSEEFPHKCKESDREYTHISRSDLSTVIDILQECLLIGLIEV